MEDPLKQNRTFGCHRLSLKKGKKHKTKTILSEGSVVRPCVYAPRFIRADSIKSKFWN